MQARDTREYESTLRSFEQSLEQSLEDKDWDRMMSVNQELQSYFQMLSDDGVVSLPPVQRALTRVQVLPKSCNPNFKRSNRGMKHDLLIPVMHLSSKYSPFKQLHLA